MAFPTAYHGDSDADDEYERSVLTSPILPTDDEDSPTDSDPPSNEHTPTTLGNGDLDRLSPRTIITEWTSEECADFLTSLGLSQYSEIFMENEIVGEVLIVLKHDELKEMGITSVGHRLTILKGVYDVKVKQDIPIESDHYIPLSADASLHDKTATQEDISRIIHSIKLRDERILAAETELRKVTEEYRRLREELLPVFRMAKERSQPLPHQPAGSAQENHSYDGMSSPVLFIAPEKGSLLSRKLSKKALRLNFQPKIHSPTHIPRSVPVGATAPTTEHANLDPTPAASAATKHLGASINGGIPQPIHSPIQPNIPSPTSTYHHPPPSAVPRSYARERDNATPSTSRSIHTTYPEELPHTQYAQSTASTLVNDRFDRSNPTPTPGRSRGLSRDQEYSPASTSGGREAPSVEIFKSFRVSLDDPCWKVLPAALKKYNINADWRQYSLYIVYGDQERCLSLEEKPLDLFKQLDKEGRKPMFMLRRLAVPIEGYGGPPNGSGTSFDGSNGLGSQRAHQSSIQLPGGVL
ncbi:Adaptor for signal transduction [Agyrium rufum]|nr:Adaptor for signal transduction [Agyrium rufum]